MEKEKLSLKVCTIIILFIHFKRIILHMPVIPFRNANIYKKTLAANSPIHHMTCHMTISIWFFHEIFIQRIIALFERKGKILPINHTFQTLVKATGKTVRTWQYICKKVHIVMQNNTLTILFIYKICMIPAKTTLHTRSTLLSFHRTTTCTEVFYINFGYCLSLLAMTYCFMIRSGAFYGLLQISCAS